MSQEKSATIHITKLDAARRQLQVGIQLLFNNGDPIAVHTLIGAASTIISDLVEAKHPDESWDKFAQEENNITPKEYFAVMRQAQNFFKHADNDPEATFDFSLLDTECLAFWTVMNLGAFGLLSMEASVLQLWYLACHAPNLDANIEPYPRAIAVFGDLRNVPRVQRLAAAKRVLNEQLADTGQSDIV